MSTEHTEVTCQSDIVQDIPNTLQTKHYEATSTFFVCMNVCMYICIISNLETTHPPHRGTLSDVQIKC